MAKKLAEHARVDELCDLWQTTSERRLARSAKRHAVLTVAAHMFLENGAHRVSLAAIADRLNITKPALYNYFVNRDDIMFECFRLSNESAANLLAAIENSAASARERLAAFIRGYAALITSPFGALMIRLDDRDLPDSKRAVVRRYKRDIDSRVRSMVKQGMTDGSLAQCDPKLAAFAILGSVNWIGHWYDPSSQFSIDEIGTQFVSLILDGLAPRT